MPPIVDLPAVPNLEQQRKRAKDLLKALRAGDAEALVRVRRSHPRLAGSRSQTIVADAQLTDAQWVIAREYGFASWARLKAHIEALAGKTERRRPFENDLQYYRDRAAGMLSVLATGEQNAIRLVRVFHPHYAAVAESDIRDARLTQADAELILAREHGFPSWDAFANHIEALRERRVTEPFALAFEAIKADDGAGLAALLAKHRGLANAAGTNGNRLIMLAMSFGRIPMIEALLAAGADPNLPNNKGWTALHQAAYSDPTRSQDSIAILERLLAAGASPYSEAYGDGGTPLMVSLFWGHRVLAERLAAIAVVPLNLRVAAGLGRLDLMHALFTKDGLRPEANWHREFHRPHSGFPPWRPSDEHAEILAEALTYAARSGRIDAMAFLLERGVNIDAEPYNGTSLHWAVARRRPEAVTWLLNHGADVSRRAAFGGTRGVTPLHVAAAWEGSPDCARILLARGADRSVKDPEHGGTPASWAAFFKNEAIGEMIAQG
jgi:ankyrin repeat protein